MAAACHADCGAEDGRACSEPHDATCSGPQIWVAQPLLGAVAALGARAPTGEAPAAYGGRWQRGVGDVVPLGAGGCGGGRWRLKSQRPVLGNEKADLADVVL
ncbi:unnamed protein product [Miscanthus lutarioriparius]|uniref:Uncharacterized protein n=1 Tax=Miscanthus lutarioriparius TaxID=422564 RepID=A0A811NDT0_9POAL|nr:unnamed protein product [Miscanthus lutarioriparius]